MHKQIVLYFHVYSVELWLSSLRMKYVLPVHAGMKDMNTRILCSNTACLEVFEVNNDTGKHAICSYSYPLTVIYHLYFAFFVHT